MEREQSAADILESLSDEELKQLPQEDIDFLLSEAEAELTTPITVGQVEKPSLLGAVGESATRGLKSLGTALESAADTALFGYLPQLKAGAAISAETDRFGFKDEPTFLEQDKYIPAEKSYIEERDRAAAEMLARQEENPTAATVGKALGVGASMLFPGLASARVLRGGGAILGAGGAKAIGRVGAAATEAAALSALQNPGDAPGEADPLQLRERATNFLETITSPTNLALSSLAGIAPRASKAIDEPPPILGKDERKALSLLEPTPSDFQEIITRSEKSSQGPKEIAKFIKNNRIGKMGDDYEQIYSKSKSIERKFGDEIEKFYQENSDRIEKEVRNFLQKSKDKNWVKNNPDIVRSLKAFNSPEYFSDLLLEFKRKTRFQPDAKQAFDVLNKHLNSLVDEFATIDPRTGMLINKKPNLLELHEMRRSIDAKINEFNTARAMGTISAEASASDKAFNFLREKINDAIFDEVEVLGKITGKDLGRKIKDLNKNYSTATVVTDLARKSFARDFSKDARMSSILSPIADILEPKKGQAEAFKNIGSSVIGKSKEIGVRSLEQAARLNQMANPSKSVMVDYIKIDPAEVPDYEYIINSDPEMSTIEKAKRIQLLKKYNLFKPL
jgi:hypothetical protein